MAVFDDLYALNFNDHVEKKTSGGTELSYLSWTWAWAEIKKRYPDANYEVIEHDCLPYVYDPNTGYMVFTSVTIDGITHKMWLPVMDGNNRAMKSFPYEISFKNGKTITIAPATMFDINKTIMRCLVKNLAMFGLGLYIYAGEDLPEPEKELEEENKKAEEAKKEEAARHEAAKKQANLLSKRNEVVELLSKEGITMDFVFGLYKISSVEELTEAKCNNIVKHIDDIKKKVEDSKNE